MGDRQQQRFQVSFNSSLRVEFQGARVTSDGGLLLVRELDERLSLGEAVSGEADLVSWEDVGVRASAREAAQPQREDRARATAERYRAAAVLQVRIHSALN